uniref:transglutaminase-like domain-containing protein n=1 Tax=uncultured Draconibacterium sp. TaxID=1573823 RepID=UPI0032166703
MEIVRKSFILFFVILIGSCRNSGDTGQDVEQLIKQGEFNKATKLLEQKIEKNTGEPKETFLIQLETINRIRKEFPYTRMDIKKHLKKYYPGLSEARLDEWEEARQLEMRIIDGEKRYFNRSVSNLFRLNAEARKVKESVDGDGYSGVTDFQESIIPLYFQKEFITGEPFNLQRIKVNYTIRLKPNQVPAGEIVRCWLPYPRTGLARLPKVEFLNSEPKDAIIAPEEALQRTVYMEKKAINNEETAFSVSYIFEAAAQWFDVKPEQVQLYDKSSELYKKYTSERLPHIIFSEEVTNQARKIVGEETNPVKQVELLFYWIDQNIPWAGALEYSTMECIPEYVLENRHGDCGMKTFLFMSMARSLGIPCKWQSGWYLLPQEKNLHDWAEVYIEGIGWVPVDQSFGLIDSPDKRVKEFYLNGMDNYRLVVNDDYAQDLYPPKKHYRSEPYDFQRGELEWDGGNLYFDQWSYNMQVEYLD